jgi:hypothetical protein
VLHKYPDIHTLKEGYLSVQAPVMLVALPVGLGMPPLLDLDPPAAVDLIVILGLVQVAFLLVLISDFNILMLSFALLINF